MDLVLTLFLVWVVGSAAWFYTEKAISLFRKRKVNKHEHSRS